MKQRTKRYKPKLVSVPPFLSCSTRDLRSWEKALNVDSTYLLRVYNSTATIEDLQFLVKVIQIAWVLADLMEETQSLRQKLKKLGLESIAVYIECKQREKPMSRLTANNIADAIDIARDIICKSGVIERSQAAKAVLFDGYSPGFGI